MKGSIIAAVVLVVIVALVACNSLYVQRSSDSLLAALNALPESPDPATTPAEVAGVRHMLEDRIPILGLSVNYNVLDRITESLIALEAHAVLGDIRQYAAVRAVLEDMLDDLSRAEKLSAENIT